MKYSSNIKLSYVLYKRSDEPEKPSQPIHCDNHTFNIDVDGDSSEDAILQIKSVIKKIQQNSNQEKIAKEIMMKEKENIHTDKME